MDWLNAHRFYLPEEVCDELNKIKEATKERMLKAKESVKTPVDFKSNAVMNDSYFNE